MSKIETFRDLRVWQKAHELVLNIYKVTQNLPQAEKFGLVSQVRRAVISVASNIVEGFHRNSIKESLWFYNIAQAFLEEVKYQLLIAKDLSYVSLAIYQESLGIADQVGKMLHSWIGSQIKNSRA